MSMKLRAEYDERIANTKDPMEAYPILNANSPVTRVTTTIPHTAETAAQEQRTIQDLKSSCDLNAIFAKARKTGVIDHVNKFEAGFGEVSSMDFEEAFNTIKETTEEFNNLSGAIRAKFRNSVANYLEFMSVYENRNAEALLSASPNRDNLASATGASPETPARESGSTETASEDAE